jgi:dienelactone hydrolase
MTTPTTWKRALTGALLICGLASGCAAPAPLPVDELTHRLKERNLVLTPDGEGPFPAVLVLHTCYGYLGHVVAWAAHLQRRGYVAVVVNSMQVRDLDGHFDRMAVCGGRVLRAPERGRDIRISIEQLKAQSEVDPNRIGLMGFSHGGWTALGFLGQSAGIGARARSAPGSGAIRSVVTVYPYCGDEAMDGLAAWPRDVRLLMLLAGNDTTVGTAKCRALAEEQRGQGFAVELHVYPGAEHGYDIDPAMIYGYDQRYDEAAAEDTRKRILGFLEMTLKANSGSASARRPVVRSQHARSRQYVQSSHSRMR